jgi:hypothetical protein
MTKSVRMIFGYNWAIIYSEVFLLENVFLWPKSLNDLAGFLYYSKNKFIALVLERIHHFFNVDEIKWSWE